MIKSTIAILLVLGGLIFFHELGHFLVARLLRIGVRKFSLGFGPRLFGFSSGLTEYKVSAVPLGGYVQLVGENPDDTLPDGFTREMSYSARPPWQRIVVVAAGPLFNIVLAWLLYWVIFAANGRPEILPVIGEVQKDTPALAAGIQKGDRVLTIDGRKIEYWDQLASTIQQSEGRTLTFTVARDSETLTMHIKPELQVRRNIFGEEVSQPMVGIAASGQAVMNRMSPGTALGAALEQTWNVSKLTVQGFIKIIERIIPLENIGGPIMIAQLVSQQAAEGLFNVMALAAVISVNLAILNLLPIPVLDGGHILFFTLEMIIRHPLDERWQQISTRIGIAFLLALMGLALYNDLARVLL